MRVRISTALLCVGVLGVALHFVLSGGPRWLVALLGATPLVLLVAFLAALITAGVLGFRRNVPGTVQSVIEAGVCFGAFFLLPRY